MNKIENLVDVSMDGIQLEHSKEKSELLLGCQLEPGLKWHIQVEELVKKLKKIIFGLAKLKFIVPYTFRNTLTLGMFNSVLVY